MKLCLGIVDGRVVSTAKSHSSRATQKSKRYYYAYRLMRTTYQCNRNEIVSSLLPVLIMLPFSCSSQPRFRPPTSEGNASFIHRRLSRLPSRLCDAQTSEGRKYLSPRCMCHTDHQQIKNDLFASFFVSRNRFDVTLLIEFNCLHALVTNLTKFIHRFRYHEIVFGHRRWTCRVYR